MADHRHERADTGATGNQQQGAARVNIPDEVSTNRPAQLELVAFRKHVDQVGRDLPVVNPLNSESYSRGVLWRRGDRVTALGLVAIIRGQADVDVLPGAMAGPTRHGENQR